MNFFKGAVFCASLLLACPGQAGSAANEIFHSIEDVSGKRQGLPVYWVCGKTAHTQVRVICDDLGINELEGPKGELQIAIRSGTLIHEYGLRHGIPMSECIQMQNAIKRLLRRSAEYCIRGHFVGAQLESPTGIWRVGWVFFEFKSKKGLVSD